MTEKRERSKLVANRAHSGISGAVGAEDLESDGRALVLIFGEKHAAETA